MPHELTPNIIQPGAAQLGLNQPDLPSAQTLLARIQELEDCLDAAQNRLREAEDILTALRSGDVDAIVAPGPEGDRVYTLKGADESYRVMVQEMAEGALTLTTDGLILFANQPFAALAGCPLSRVIGSRFLDFVAAEDVAIASALIGRSGVRKAEVRLSPDGTTQVPAYLSVQDVVLDGVACHCLIVTDLSKQKRYDEILAIMETVPVGVLISHDAECTLRTMNRKACEMLRLPAGTENLESAVENETYRNWRKVRDGREIPAAELPMQLAARSGQPVQDYEFEMAFDDGTSRCWLANAMPLFSETGAPRGAVAALLDITERKRAAETQEAANAEMRDFVHALTQGLQEPARRVLHSTRSLEREIDGKLGVATGKHLALSVAGALQMETLLAKLIHYWEITECSGESLVSVDCGALLKTVLVSLETEIQRSGAIVTSGSLPVLVAGKAMLSELFRDLIANSISHRGDATPKIDIAAVRAGERWMFSVRDNGIGIAREDIPRVFDMFGRPNEGSVPGAGIALATCRKIVERLGGRIWAESEQGEGAAFRFTIPAYLELAVAPVG